MFTTLFNRTLPVLSKNITKTAKHLHLSRCTHKSKPPWKLIFYGTDDISVVTLNKLHINAKASVSRVVESLEVVCIKSECPVRKYASENSLVIHTWPYEIPRNVYDLGVVVSFGHMIPSESIQACKYGMINAHPSLLPRWRGAAPIIHTILHGDAETGVTITEVSPNKFDVGKILLQKKYQVPVGFSSKDLTAELSEMAADMLIETLQDLTHFLENSFPQPTEGVKYASKIKTVRRDISWAQDSALTIYRKFKAFHEYCDLCIYWCGTPVVLEDCILPESTDVIDTLVAGSNPVPGYCYYHKKRKVVFVKTQDGWLGISRVRIPKRGVITALDFYNGFLSKEPNPQRRILTTLDHVQSTTIK